MIGQSLPFRLTSQEEVLKIHLNIIDFSPLRLGILG